MKYKFILFDIDDTLLDFLASERKAICLLFDELEIKYDDALLTAYSDFNISLWKQLELGYITKTALQQNRFVCFFAEHNICADGEYAAKRYLFYLSLGADLLDGATELLSALYGKAGLYAVTNGDYNVQTSRIALSGVGKYFTDVFISGKVGYQKPRIEFFEYVQSSIPDFDKRNTLQIGDSLSSDIKGGSNFGIDTCWFNRTGQPNNSGFKPTFTISDLSDILSILNIQ